MSETLIVEFGAGKVGVMRTSEQGEDFESGVAFVHQEAHPIGEAVPGYIGKNTDEVCSFLRFHFSNSKSLQVLIDDLLLVCASMKAVEQPLAPDGETHLCGGKYYTDKVLGEVCCRCQAPRR